MVSSQAARTAVPNAARVADQRNRFRRLPGLAALRRL